MMVEFDLVNGRVSDLGALNPGEGSEIWANGFVRINAPAMHLNEGRGADLLQIYDATSDRPSQATQLGGIMSGFNVLDTLPYVILAMRDAGRDDEAKEPLSLTRTAILGKGQNAL